MTFRKRAGFAFFFVVFTVVGANAESGRFYLDLNGGYKTGSFGTRVRSDLMYCSSELGYASTRYEASITVPYLFLKNSVENSDISSAANGVGDIIVRGGAVLLAEGESGFSLDGALAVKLSTADRSKGLGSGETDVGAFINADQRFHGVKLTLMAGFIKIGHDPTVAFNDIFLYGAGVSRIFGFTNIYTSFEGRTAMISGSFSPAEIHAGVFQVLNKDISLKGNLFAGLNSGGPRFGSEVGVMHWF
jgi:hypothetical protein